ncbi:Complement component C9 [Folsomia candida]|uniref:Complement component C9 n=1 Tax=Folsomia candida TaxID=158441 RepID=A0A226F3U4_FOLCA|nr:Complement component C9 [Folsomia candida]
MVSSATLAIFFSTTFYYLFICSTLVSGNVEVQTGGTEIFELATLCKGHYPTQMHRKIDGAVIQSLNDKNLDCVITFSAEYVSQRFLIRFTEFNMECGAHLIADYLLGKLTLHYLICRPSSYLRQCECHWCNTGHYVTLKFTADSWGTETNKFTMVITAFKDPSQGCRDGFVCGNDMCITNRILCDKTPNCLDGSDELRSANCTSNFLDMLSSIDSPAEIGILGGLMVISMVIVITCFCYCTRHRRRTPPQSPDIYNHGKSRSEASGSNGAGTMITLSDKPSFHHNLHHHQQNTLESLRKKTGNSLNLHLPAGTPGRAFANAIWETKSSTFSHDRNLTKSEQGRVVRVTNIAFVAVAEQIIPVNLHRFKVTVLDYYDKSLSSSQGLLLHYVL